MNPHSLLRGIHLKIKIHILTGNISSKEWIWPEIIHIGFKQNSHTSHIAAQLVGCEMLERSAMKVARSFLRRGH
jgi:hypothetical protein